jgi:two-component system nitrogen regulation response regulator NtrX
VADERRVVDLDVRLLAAVEPRPIGLANDCIVRDERVLDDLYTRLPIRLDVPPLRRRREDIPLIVTSTLRRLAAGRPDGPQACSRAALSLLTVLPWPGNRGELETLLGALVASVSKPVLQIEDLFEHIRLDGLIAPVEAGESLRTAKARFERDWISAVLIKHHGRVGEAAKALGIQRTNLYRKVRQLKVARTLLGARREARQSRVYQIGHTIRGVRPGAA